jgi:hypothetical protein
MFRAISRTIRRRVHHRRMLIRLFGVGLATAALAAIGVAPAHAFTWENNGCPGTIEVPTTNGYYNFGPSFEFPTRVARRSACYATSTQTISVRYRLWGYNFSAARWEYYTELTRAGSVPPGYALKVAGFGGGSTRGAISADVLVEWRLPNGVLIGSQYINYNNTADYGCPMGGCRIYQDPIMGAYIRFG